MATVVLSVASMNAQSLFESVDGMWGIDHTYLSPEFLKTVPNERVSSLQMSFPASDLTTMDIVVAHDTEGRDAIWKVMKDIKKSQGLKNLAQRVYSGGRVDLLGKPGKDKTFSQLMLIEQTGLVVRITYLTGRLTTDNIHVNW